MPRRHYKVQVAISLTLGEIPRKREQAQSAILLRHARTVGVRVHDQTASVVGAGTRQHAPHCVGRRVGVIEAVRVSVTLAWRIAASEPVPGAVAVIRASLPHRGTTRQKQTLVAWRSARTEGNAISEGRYFGTMLNDTTCRRAAIGGSFAAPPGMAAQAKS